MGAKGQRIRHIRRWAAAALVAAGAAGAAGPVAARDGIAGAKLQRAVAEQKAADDVARAVQDAAAVAKVSKPRAVERLKQTLLALDLSPEIGTAKRKELADQLQARIDALEGRGPAPAADPNAAGVKADARKAYEAAVAEAREVADAINKGAALADGGREEDARRLIAGVARKYPNNPSLLALQQRDGFAAQVQAERELSRQYAAAWVENTRGVVRDSTPLAGDIQFPDRKKWEDISRRRLQPAVKLTPKEEKILESLNKSVGVIFRDRPFEESVQELSNMIDQPIFIDKKSLEDLGLDLSRRVSFSGNVSGRTALRAVLQSLGLTFVVKDEMIQVMTLERAQQTLVTRSYYLGDLIAGNGAFGNAVAWGPFLSYQQTLQNAQFIIDAITSSIDPMAWNTGSNRGPCTISFHLPTMSIVVRASAEVHATLGNTFTGKR